MKYPQETYRWATEKKYFELANYLKDHYSAMGSIIVFRELTGQPFHNLHDLSAWQGYGGRLSDEEFRECISNWDDSDDFYLDLIKSRGFTPQ